ncbi:hypothetical protein PDJAM_G00155800, partial [Pangasius djambal]|nr:hypothetical protein [Pangasius djambal]
LLGTAFHVAHQDGCTRGVTAPLQEDVQPPHHLQQVVILQPVDPARRHHRHQQLRPLRDVPLHSSAPHHVPPVRERLLPVHVAPPQGLLTPLLQEPGLQEVVGVETAMAAQGQEHAERQHTQSQRPRHVTRPAQTLQHHASPSTHHFCHCSSDVIPRLLCVTSWKHGRAQ